MVLSLKSVLTTQQLIPHTLLSSRVCKACLPEELCIGSMFRKHKLFNLSLPGPAYLRATTEKFQWLVCQ